MQASGNVLRSRARFLKEQGEEACARVLAALSPETRELVEKGFLETEWYELETLIELSVVTDQVLGKGDLELCYQMGVHSCEQNLTGVYRAVFKFGNLNFILDRASKAWREQYSAGEMKVVERSRDHVVVELRHITQPHKALFAAIRGWMAKAAELTGEEIIEIKETYPGGDVACRWETTLL